jgi:anaerobic ribonucleoside-triphosphate reductase activating protein
LAGVTFSGGEPFEQAIALSELAAMIRGKGLNVLVYTGYRLDALRAGGEKFAPLLAEVDILIDGEYRADRPGPLIWRGSDNQNICPLTPEGEALIGSRNSKHGSMKTEIQVSLTRDGVRLSGFPNAQVQEQLVDKLAERGILVRPVRPTIQEKHS